MFIFTLCLLVIASAILTGIIENSIHKELTREEIICNILSITGLVIVILFCIIALTSSNITKDYVVNEVLHDYTSSKIQTEINVTYLNNNISKTDTIYYYK